MEAGSRDLKHKTNILVLGRGGYPDELPCHLFVKHLPVPSIKIQYTKNQSIELEEVARLPFGASSNNYNLSFLRKSVLCSVVYCTGAEVFINFSDYLRGDYNPQFSSHCLAGDTTSDAAYLYLFYLGQLSCQPLLSIKGD